MPIRFNSILRDSGFDPATVRLLRHKDQRAARGRSIFELWRDDRCEFERYQSVQQPSQRKKFCCDYWAAFVCDAFDATVFAGLYAARYLGLNLKTWAPPHNDNPPTLPGHLDEYQLKLCDDLSDLIGRLVIDWGPGTRQWVQHAERQDKPILELRPHGAEPPFPGYLQFCEPLSRISKLPITWRELLKAAHGIYLLTCPRTQEQYVGSADGEEGFWGRWMTYSRDGHGGNVKLRSRDPSDYQVTILEVAGSSASRAMILETEALWKHKLQSIPMGLNGN